jgi:hypothetical protein
MFYLLLPPPLDMILFDRMKLCGIHRHGMSMVATLFAQKMSSLLPLCNSVALLCVISPSDSRWLLNRLCQTATTDLIPSPESLPHSHNDVNYDVVLRNCNSQLSGWMETWSTEMQRGRSLALIKMFGNSSLAYCSAWGGLSFLYAQPFPPICSAFLK